MAIPYAHICTNNSLNSIWNKAPQELQYGSASAIEKFKSSVGAILQLNVYVYYCRLAEAIFNNYILRFFCLYHLEFRIIQRFYSYSKSWFCLPIRIKSFMATYIAAKTDNKEQIIVQRELVRSKYSSNACPPNTPIRIMASI